MQPRPVMQRLSSVHRRAFLSTAASASGHLLAVPISPVFGARLSGLDTSTTATPDDAYSFRSLLAEHKMVILPGGRLSVPELVAFGSSLGLGKGKPFGATKEIRGAELASAEVEGQSADLVMEIEYGPGKPAADINIWHQDHSWHADGPTRWELSYADEVPVTAGGGDVLYADAGAAWASLSPALQQLLLGTTCLYNLADGYQNIEPEDRRYAQAMLDHPPVEMPTVRRERRRGEKYLRPLRAVCFLCAWVRCALPGVCPVLHTHTDVTLNISQVAVDQTTGGHVLNVNAAYTTRIRECVCPP